MTDDPRDLQFPLDTSIVLENETPDEPVGGRPIFPDDPELRIIVPVELTADEFTMLASVIDVGRDLTYPTQSQFVWWLWNRIWLAMTLCEAVAQCFTDENEALMQALADALTNNQLLRDAITTIITSEGSGIPGKPLPPELAGSNTLPDEVKNEDGSCNFDKLWGAMLFLVRSGYRTITDFFEVMEVISNSLEAAAKAAKLIPAVGDYVGSAVEFADWLKDTIAEAFQGAYTEGYEQNLACTLFCLSRTECDLSLDSIVSAINQRLSAPVDIGDFGEIMNGLATGTWVGDEVADVAFLVYFSALKFGQQFGDTIGVRPLTVLMALGADELESNNWMVLCECAEALTWENVGILADCGAGVKSDGTFESGVPFDVTAYEDSDGGNWLIALKLPAGDWSITLDVFDGTAVSTGGGEAAYAWHDTGGTLHYVTWGTPASPADFPADTETAVTVFAPWCGSVGFNAMLNNGAPFTATFTVTAI